MGSFVLKTCFGFCCFVFVLGIFWWGSCFPCGPCSFIMPVCSVSPHCLVFLRSWSQAEIGGHLSCASKIYKKYSLGIRYQDIKCAHRVRRESISGLTLFMIFPTDLKYKYFQCWTSATLNHSITLCRLQLTQQQSFVLFATSPQQGTQDCSIIFTVFTCAAIFHPFGWVFFPSRATGEQPVTHCDCLTPLI